MVFTVMTRAIYHWAILFTELHCGHLLFRCFIFIRKKFLVVLLVVLFLQVRTQSFIYCRRTASSSRYQMIWRTLSYRVSPRRYSFVVLTVSLCSNHYECEKNGQGGYINRPIHDIVPSLWNDSMPAFTTIAYISLLVTVSSKLRALRFVWPRLTNNIAS